MSELEMLGAVCNALAGGDAWGRIGGRKWGGGDEQLVQVPFVLTKPGWG